MRKPSTTNWKKSTTKSKLSKEKEYFFDLTQTEQKSQYKKQTSVQNARIDEIKANLKLGDACIKELQKDIHDFEDDIDYTENQIRRFESRIHKAEKKPSVRQEKKPF